MLKRPRWDSVTAGTGYGVLSAITYMAANLALREVAIPGDSDWAIWVSCIKSVPAATAAWIIIGYRSIQGLAALPPRRLFWPLLWTGLFMQFGGNVLFQFALGVGGLALTVPLNFSTLILSGAWLGRAYLGEPITVRSAAAMGGLILSIVFLSVGAKSATLSLMADASLFLVVGGVAAAAVAGIIYGATGVIIRGVVTRDVSLSATLVLLSTTGVVGLGIVSLIRLGPEQMLATTGYQFQVMLAAGVLNAIAFFAVSAALQRISVVRTNLLNASQTAMAAALGVALFNEPMTVWLVAGTLFTVIGLAAMESRKKQQ